jgi:starch phosphorylase
MIKTLGCEVEKYHMNEGHSSLLAIELFKNLKGDIEAVRERCVFTTHTPVPAGHDKFDIGLVEDFLREYLTNDLKGMIYYENALNMTYLGLRFSKHINGVARKHGEVSRSMFPGYNIESITNGVHSAFWSSNHMRKLYDKYIPSWRDDPSCLRYIMGVPKEVILKAHQRAKEDLIETVNKYYGVNMKPDVFTIGFARRAASYKRGDMLFSDVKR